jgi:hypothetical protein
LLNDHGRRSEPLNFLSRLFLIAFSDLGHCIRVQKNEKECDDQQGFIEAPRNTQPSARKAAPFLRRPQFGLV